MQVVSIMCWIGAAAESIFCVVKSIQFAKYKKEFSKSDNAVHELRMQRMQKDVSSAVGLAVFFVIVAIVFAVIDQNISNP